MTGKQVLVIVIATFVTVVIWVSSDIYHSRKQVTTPPELQQLLEPVEPSFNQSALEKIE